MSLKLSTGLRNHMMATGSFKSAMDGGFIKVYSGAEPASPDDSLGAATLLVTFTKDGDGTTGLTFAASATGGALSKNADIWRGTVGVSGTASFYRFVKTGDTGAASTTDIRIQGKASTLPTNELQLSSLSLVATAVETANFCTYGLPEG